MLFADDRKTACAFHVKVGCTPPTLASAKQHSCRAYHQVQQWLHEQKNLSKWGWKTIGGHLRPITTTHPASPEDLLSVIVCTCKDECVQNCECRKSGLNCSNMCSNCSRLGCVNRDILIIEDDDLQLDEEQEDTFPTTRLNELFDAH
ncbi:hypothetical protein AVEN_120170-1 [Araneus ventricosus]|uniref:Tesmin/TSO1-like CXC domain-containing protein n=1 Tax=Araneus ventricosus TaxID=182803 RepID=A0A4Y2GR38_ARAVE|nr:hypothetical protein AVEN_120170-1 [Araneus ventricosus]